MNSHQSFKISYKRGKIKGKDMINDALSTNRNMWFESKFSEISGKIEYNFLDYFDEVTKENFTPYLFFGIATTLLKNTKERKSIEKSYPDHSKTLETCAIDPAYSNYYF